MQIERCKKCNGEGKMLSSCWGINKENMLYPTAEIKIKCLKCGYETKTHYDINKAVKEWIEK